MNHHPGRVLVASNRGPVSFSLDHDGTLTARRGGGGLVSGLSDVGLSDLLWVCSALNDADRTAARQAPDGRLDQAGYDTPVPVQMLPIPPDTFDLAYNAVSNSIIWFVHHLLYDTPNQPRFGAEFARQWAAYQDYNAAFADALAAAASPSPASPSPASPGPAGTGVRVMVQDYHLALVPGMLARRCPGVRIAHFSHTPWAPPEYYRLLPEEAGRALLEGILGADHAGFHSERWADAFIDCCREILGAEVDRDAGLVTYQGHRCRVGVHPLGVDAAELRRRAAEPDVEEHITALSRATNGARLIVRIDRTELSKNIVRGLAAYRELLSEHPELHGHVTHLACAYPSRYDLPQYREYTASVEQIAGEISAEFRRPGWEPLILQVKDDYARSLAAYRLADVVVVNPIRDGMNLVAKECPVLSDRGCVLILSRETGACPELGRDALVVNPYDVSATARAMYQALVMPQPERERRCAALARTAGARPPGQWLADQLNALD
ncbi:MAG TPA: trehalose-6-phosphate synthase [Streptosporangiaceae bacterium]|nr:trehalose-6-phosphate synthase [Streptosporangiaceae bacterium]